MARKKIAAVVLSLGCFSASSAYSLGLGDLSLESFLNEPFRARVNLLNLGGLHEDQIRIKLATTEDFDRLGVDRAYFLTSLTFEVEVDETGKGQIVISSQDPVLEPYLDFIVEARWPSGRLLREYTVLVDPPTFDTSTPVVSASQRVSEVEGSPDPRAKKNDKSAVSEGTRVDVRKSDLAPGAMPEREYWSETAGRPAPGSRYLIRRDETLWSIAAKAAPEGVSVYQTMLEIQRLNPDAFLDGNINRIKAGYIIYLPGAGEISEADQSAAIEEVRQQNAEWREGVSSLERRGLARPSLRISADPVSGDQGGGPGGADETVSAAAGSDAADEQADSDGLAQLEMEERVVAMEQQVETLQRIVSLKDEQIAALQQALADAEAEATDQAGSEPVLQPDLEAVADDTGEVSGAPADTAMTEPAAPAPAPQPAPKAEPAVPTAGPQSSEQDGGLMSKLVYGLVALAVAIIALLLWRRRSSGEEEALEQAAPVASRDDAFAGVELGDPLLDVQENGDDERATDEFDLAATVTDMPAVGPEDDNRGYGQRRHDEYASDVDTGDALAEADIYIAYGRYPQAVELLRTAIANEPGNPAYHLKLMEIASETSDRAELERQYAELQAIGDNNCLAQADALLGRDQGAGLDNNPLGDLDSSAEDLSPPPELAGGSEPLEADFSGLEIDIAGDDQEELDLSADFEQPAGLNGEDESLVVAAEGNEMSTKLDLARAYLDMGDTDGARQILEEVIAEGSEEQEQEARSLLARIG